MHPKVQAAHELKKDDPDQEREVAHWFYFADKEDMDKFIIAIMDLDHRVECSYPPSKISSRWGLVTSMEHDVHSGTLMDNYGSLTELAERFHGEYDGYEYQIGGDGTCRVP